MALVCGLLFLMANAAQAQAQVKPPPKHPPKPAPKQAQRPAPRALPPAQPGAAEPAPVSPPEHNPGEGAKENARTEERDHDRRRDWDRKEEEKRKGIEVVVPAGPELGLLRKAYIALSKADHDYDWHRVHAMQHTAEAASILGETLAGDGHAREAQMTSDAELREADGFLASAHVLAMEHRRPRVADLITAARRQIAVALDIR